jgi:hypothetical protein
MRLDVHSHLEAVVRNNPAHHPIRMTLERGSSRWKASDPAKSQTWWAVGWATNGPRSEISV